MASSTFSPKAQRPEVSTPDRPVKPNPKQPRRSWRGLLAGLVIVIILVGLGVLAVSGATGNQVATTTATPAATARVSASPSASAPSTQAASASVNTVSNPFEARPVLYNLVSSTADYQTLYAAMADGLRR